VTTATTSVGPGHEELQRWRPLRLVVLLTVAALASLALAAWSLTHGAENLSLSVAWKALTGDGQDATSFVVQEIRLPRVTAALVCGAALGIAGVILQDALRNPIADPGLLGISQSVSFVGVMLVLFPGAVPDLARPVLFLGAGLLTGVLLVLIARSVRDPVRLILIGFLLAMFYSTFTEVVTLLGPQNSGDELASFFRFQIGSLAGVSWDQLEPVWIWLALSIPGAMLTGRALNLLQLGDDVATGLGMNVVRSRLVLLFVAVFLVAPAVSVCGPVEFVALISPHVCRSLLASTNSYVVLPAAAAVGGVTVLAADTIGRLLFFPIEVPAGLWTLIVIGPAAVWLAGNRLGGTKGAD
jgi:iron complex transport system permease protein